MIRFWPSRALCAVCTAGLDMSSLCPHLFEEYLKKVSEILETYKPQILTSIHYKDISKGLLSHKVIKKREHEGIMKMSEGSEQMAKVLEIVKSRMWGLENFMTSLIDGNKDTWLSEELFDAYVRHLVVNMKKMQTEGICDCFHGGKSSVLYKSWLRALDSFDGYLYRIGGSLGFLTSSMYPVNSVLEFIRQKLPISRQKIVTVTQADLESSDSDEGEIDVPCDPEECVKPKTDNSSARPVPTSRFKTSTKPIQARINSNSSHFEDSTPSRRRASNPAAKVVQPRTSLTSTPRTSLTSTPRTSLTSTPRTKVLHTPNKSKPPVIPRTKPEHGRNRISLIDRQRERARSNVNSKFKQNEVFPPSKPVPVKRTAEFGTGTNEKPGDTYLPTTSFDSVSLSTSSGDEINHSDSPFSDNDDERVLAALASSDFYIDDDAVFMPASLSQSESATASTTTTTISSNITPRPISRKINGNVKVLETSGSPSIRADKNPARSSLGFAPSNLRQVKQVQPSVSSLAKFALKPPAKVFTVAPASLPVKIVQTVSISTQTNLSETIVSEPPEINLNLTSTSTQTTPPTLRKLSARSNSYPGGLLALPQHDSSSYYHTVNPNTFRSLEIQKSDSSVTTINIIGPRNSEDLKPEPDKTPEKKPFSRKESTRSSVVRKISAALSSAASSLKSSSSSEKKPTRTVSASCPSPNKNTSTSRTLPPRATSISSSMMPTSLISSKSQMGSKSTPRRTSITGKHPQGLGTVKPVNTATNKSVTSLNKSANNINVKTSAAPKPPIIPIRQRVQEEIREKKANAPPPPPPINQDRLSPQDYNFQQWSHVWTSKQTDSENVQNNNV